MFKNNLSEVFPFVHSLYDVSELILVGSDIASWLNIVSGYDLEKVHYINQGDQKYNFETLPQNWESSSKLLAKEDGDITFYTLSNPMLNGTVSSDVLVNLWQNLETLETTQKEAVSIKTFIAKECSVSGSKMLVVDSFDGLSLVDELDSLQVDVVALRVVADEEEIFANVSDTKVKQKLQECGYKNIATYEDNHPKIKTAVYVKDMKRQTREYEESLNLVKQNAQKELSEIKAQLENKTKELQESITKERSAKESKEQELTKLKNELETKNKALQEKQANSEQLQKQKIELESKNKQHEEDLHNLKKTNKEKLEAEKKVELNTSLLKFQSNIKEHINKSSKNVMQQIESYIALNYYIDKPLNFHNWPISPDITLFMANKIEQENYDLILEFGSGTSTVLFANMSKQKKHNNTKDVKVISFEHSKEYWYKTKTVLKTYKLEKFAKVKYCPLEEFTYLDQLFQYYDCQNIFKKLQKNNRYEKLLVLVDGPPASIGELSRFPAIIYLLEFFPNKEIHIVLDDFSRKDEQDTLEKWEKILNSKMIKYSKEIVNTEKGLCYLKINEKGLY